MTEQAPLLPRVERIQHAMKKLPAEPVRWLLQLESYPSTAECVTALQVLDEDFALYVLTPHAWQIVKQALNGAREDRRRALFADMSGLDEGVANAD